MPIIAIDFETANSDRFSPCAIGLAWIEDGQITRREYRLIKPREMRFDHFNIKIHGIRPEDVAGSREFPDVIAEFIDEIRSSVIVAHNASFDIGVLCETSAFYGLSIPDVSYVCSLQLAKECWPNEGKLDIASLAARFGIDCVHHHARDDAYVCARVFVEGGRKIGASSLKLLLKRSGDSQARYAETVRTAVSCRNTADRKGELSFLVRGDSGSNYRVSGKVDNNIFHGRCECRAGRNNLSCKHVGFLLAGECDRVLSGNAGDLSSLVGVRHYIESIASKRRNPVYLSLKPIFNRSPARSSSSPARSSG